MNTHPAITREQMFEPLLEACPTFERQWLAFLEEYGNDTDLPLYIALTALASHLIEMLAEGPPHNLRETFRVVERWHLEGDAYVRQAATVGLLEDLQNTNLHSSTTPEQFAQFLLPETRKRWDKVRAFWEKGERLSE